MSSRIRYDIRYSPTTQMETTRIKLGALWTVVMFSIGMADIIGFIHPGTLEKIMKGEFGFPVTSELLLLF